MSHVRQPLLVIVSAFLLMLAVRGAVAWWTMQGVQPNEQQLSHFLLVETLIDLFIWIATAGAVARVIRCRATSELNRRRLEHLAEVALLAGGIAHELRNQLNALGTYLSLLRKSAAEQDGKLMERVGKLEMSATEMDELVRNFLTLARPVKDKLEQIDLRELVAEVMDFLAIEMEEAHIEVQLAAARDIPDVIGDRGKLRRVVLNLLINARQAMSEGGRITVHIHSVGGEVQLDVEDRGSGIPLENQPHVFEAFFSTKAEGSGLGLAVVKRTIEDLGGEISFDSRLGRGTTFHIRLPCAAQYRTTMRRLGRNSLEPTCSAP